MSELMTDLRQQLASMKQKRPVRIRMHSEDAKDIAQLADPNYDRDAPLVNPQLFGIPVELDDDPFILGFPQAYYEGQEDRDPDEPVTMQVEFSGRADPDERPLYPRLTELENRLIAEGATDQFTDAYKVKS